MDESITIQLTDIPDDPIERARMCDEHVAKITRAFSCRIECRVQSRQVGSDADAEVILKARVAMVGLPLPEEGV